MSAIPDQNLVRSLLRISGEIAGFYLPRFLRRRSFRSITRKSNLLSALFEEILRDPAPALPRSAALCFSEILVVLQSLKALLDDCSTRSRTHILLQAEHIAHEFNDLTLDLSSLLGILPLADLDVGDDVKDLVDLVRRQCRRSSPSVHPGEEGLRCEILEMIREIERGIIPDRSRLESIFERMWLHDSRSCRHEIECLEREIVDGVSEKWTTEMAALIGLLRYARCVVFDASTPRSDCGPGKLRSTSAVDPAVPADFRCPISLDLMRDPVVAASGQTYDRDSITRWIGSGHATCPKTGQGLAHTNLIPNRALRNLISRWSREHNVPLDSNGDRTGDHIVSGGNKAALEAVRMTAFFLVRSLAYSPPTEVANRVVHELRQLVKTRSDNRAFVAEAGAIPLLLPLLASGDPSLQVNAVTALLNLSILDANKKRIVHADGGIDGIIHVLSNGSTWRAKENAAATLLSLSSVHAYRRRIGRDPRVVMSLVVLAKEGPTTSKKDALAAILNLAGDRENIAGLVEEDVVEMALEAVGMSDVAEEAVAVLAAVAKRGGAAAVGGAQGSIEKMVRVLIHGSDWARESAAAALVQVCRRAGGNTVAELAAMPGIECVIWEVMASGTERARRKAASLSRIYRRWAAAVEAANRRAWLSATDFTGSTATAEA